MKTINEEIGLSRINRYSPTISRGRYRQPMEWHMIKKIKKPS